VRRIGRSSPTLHVATTPVWLLRCLDAGWWAADVMLVAVEGAAWVVLVLRLVLVLQVRLVVLLVVVLLVLLLLLLLLLQMLLLVAGVCHMVRVLRMLAASFLVFSLLLLKLSLLLLPQLLLLPRCRDGARVIVVVSSWRGDRRVVVVWLQHRTCRPGCVGRTL